MAKPSDIPPSARMTAHVLIVDDDPTNLRACTRVLRAAGYTVDAVDDGRVAAEAIANKSYDAIISDISMPKMNGIELLQFLRNQHDDVPMILITGAPAVETAVQALDHGAYKYLLKPISPEQLEEVTQKAVRLRQMARIRRQAAEVLGSSSPNHELDKNLQSALDGLWMAYQPIVDRNGELYGHEALLRSTDKSLPHPGAIIDAAEKLKRLHDLGRKVRKVASMPFTEIDGHCLAPEGELFVNLHPLDLEDERLISPDAPLAKIANRVVLEITERASIDSIQDLRQRVARLRQTGYRIAVDDLGAGYAGLTSFALLEPEIVKIDMTLVRDVDQLKVKQRLIASITSLCADMEILVVGEGVETEAERDTLLELGCDLFQGYFIAKPGPAFPERRW
jgi:EAL domain-containing protein (putative c-di-GMP-specific phosphodiesterase class I)